MDAIDEKIIAELTRNARISHSELAGKVLLSRNAVRQRIERLERQGHITDYTIVRAGDDTGNVVSALVFVHRQDRMRGVDVLAALKRIPEVVICEILSGDFDIMVRLEAASLERVRVIWQDIAQMPGVRDTVTALTLFPASSTAREENGIQRHRGEPRRHRLFPLQQPALHHEVHVTGRVLLVGGDREVESDGFAQFSAGSVEGIGRNGCGAIAESRDGSLSSARPLADSDRLCCGGPVLSTAGIRAACRRERARPAAGPARTARRRTHAQDTVNLNRVRRSAARTSACWATARRACPVSQAGRRCGRRRWVRGPCASAKPGCGAQ
ncbi:Lrp/AsnC family transcriptional regulator [Streptomyces viridochromogenes]|uniref:Lrp/AsnC family transcriptional regulator n=1 Tax=Streptomyces viridochromogenes TaxID=1938 RepID=UPI000AA288B6|nr:Lrp/AsnC family transcriptional regulator [Streptomyces viridochromogenes]